LNAPTSITTNEACDTYLPNNKCITVLNGGCTTNTTCSAISYKPACVKDGSGSTCFYDDASATCKDKTCINAPSTNTTHELC
jgi:Notch-like protein